MFLCTTNLLGLPPKALLDRTMRLKPIVRTAAQKDAVAKHIQLHAQCMLSKLPLAHIISAIKLFL